MVIVLHLVHENILNVVCYDGFILLKCLVTDIHEPDRPKKVLNPRSCNASMNDRPVNL